MIIYNSIKVETQVKSKHSIGEPLLLVPNGSDQQVAEGDKEEGWETKTANHGPEAEQNNPPEYGRGSSAELQLGRPCLKFTTAMNSSVEHWD